MAAVVLLAGPDRDRQPVFLGRERAGGEGAEGARGVLGAVEIEDDLAVLRRGGVEEAARAVGFVAPGFFRGGKEHLSAPAPLTWRALGAVGGTGEHGLASAVSAGAHGRHVW